MNVEAKNRANAKRFLFDELGGFLAVHARNVTSSVPLFNNNATNYIRLEELLNSGKESLTKERLDKLSALSALLLLDIAESVKNEPVYGLKLPLCSEALEKKFVGLWIAQQEFGVEYSRGFLKFVLNSLTHKTPELRALQKSFDSVRPVGRPTNNDSSLRALKESGQLQKVVVTSAMELTLRNSAVPSRDAVALELVTSALRDFGFNFEYLRVNIRVSWWKDSCRKVQQKLSY